MISKSFILLLLSVLICKELKAEVKYSNYISINNANYKLDVDDNEGSFKLSLTSSDSIKSANINSISLINEIFEITLYDLYKKLNDTSSVTLDFLKFKREVSYVKLDIIKTMELSGLTLNNDNTDDNKIEITFNKSVPVYVKKSISMPLRTFQSDNKELFVFIDKIKKTIDSLKTELTKSEIDDKNKKIKFKDLKSKRDSTNEILRLLNVSLLDNKIETQTLLLQLNVDNSLSSSTVRQKFIRDSVIVIHNHILQEINKEIDDINTKIKKNQSDTSQSNSLIKEILESSAWNGSIMITQQEQLISPTKTLNDSIIWLTNKWNNRNADSSYSVNSNLEYTKKDSSKYKDACKQCTYGSLNNQFEIERANIFIENGYLYVTYIKGNYKVEEAKGLFSIPIEKSYNKALSIDISSILTPQIYSSKTWIELDHKYGLNINASDLFELKFDPKNPSERIVVPEDKFIIIKDSIFSKPIRLRETLLNKYVTLNGFTDLAGIKEESSNGLIQLEAGITVPFIKQSYIKTTKLTFHYLKNYSAKFLYSKIENKDKFFQTFSYGIDSSNGNSVVRNDSAKFITTLNLFNHAILRFDPIKLDLITLDNKKHTFTVFAGAGFMTSAIQNSDSLITIKDTTKTVLITNDKFNANSITYSFGFNYKLKANSYFGINVGIEFIGAKLLLNKSNRKVRQSDGADGDEFRQTKFGKNLIMVPSFTAYYYPKKSYDKRIYFRASFFKDLGTQDFYPSYQLGYSQDIEVFAKSKKANQ